MHHLPWQSTVWTHHLPGRKVQAAGHLPSCMRSLLPPNFCGNRSFQIQELKAELLRLKSLNNRKSSHCADWVDEDDGGFRSKNALSACGNGYSSNCNARAVDILDDIEDDAQELKHFSLQQKLDMELKDLDKKLEQQHRSPTLVSDFFQPKTMPHHSHVEPEDKRQGRGKSEGQHDNNEEEEGKHWERVCQEPSSEDESSKSAGTDLQGSSATQNQTFSAVNYNWRKYGQKQVKKPIGFRSYYRCTYKGCPAKKTQCCDHSGRMIEIVYKGEHNHEPPR